MQIDFPRRESFILRIWQDSESTGLWRGQIQHVYSGETVSIADIKNIAIQLEDYLKHKTKEHTGLK